MSRPIRCRAASPMLLLATSLLVPATALAQASAPDSAPAGQVTSGQRVTGHTRTAKSRYLKTSPEQPAPATRQKLQPSQRLPDEPNQVKEQVAPVPDAPVAPGTPVIPGRDTPAPHRGSIAAPSFTKK